MAVLVLLSTGMALAQSQEPIVKSQSVSATATIQAIDSTTRRLTLRNEKGEEETYVVGPAVTRFNEFKVGDTVKMTYVESLVFQVRKPGEPADKAGIEAAVTRAKGMTPGATISVQEKQTVTVKSIDPAVPSITVTTEDGRTITRKIEQKKYLDGVKPGDRIDITYTEAILTSVISAK
jgi:Cu/Ag efflux protein CusF